MNKIHIFKMTLEDLNLIADTLEADFDDFWNYNVFKSELLNPLSNYFVAKQDNQILGFAGIIDTVDQLEITNIVVRKDSRSQGIGNLLLNSIIEFAKLLMKNTIMLEVNSNNEYAIKLYEKNGFKTSGLRKKYYNNKDDAKLMILKIK